MNRKLLVVLLAGLGASSLANATITWSFGSSGASGFVSQGQGFTAGGETINVYGEQVDSSGSILSTPTTCGPNNGTSCSDHVPGSGTQNTLGSSSQELFQVNGTFNSSASNFDHGTGIAPYDPAEGNTTGTYGFDNQAGINDNVPENSNSGAYSNILELNLSGVANGTVLQFLMEGPSTDPFGGGTTAVQVYTSSASTPQNLGSMTVYQNSVNNPFSGISFTGTTPQFSITKSANTNFVAIQADCHYLLLDTITGTPPSGVPEPSFYGLLAVGLIGVVFTVRRRKNAAAQA